MIPTLLQTPEIVLNIAHRGFSGQFPENTMAAFRGAVEQNADMIELDVQLSKDKVPVVFHNAKLNSRSTGKGKVENYAARDLQQLDAGSWFSSAFAGENIPILEEVIRFAKGTIALNIEIKTEAVRDEIENGVEQQCLHLVKKYNMDQQVLFSSFDERAVHHLKQLHPEIPVAILYSRRFGNIESPSDLVQEYKADAFNCSYQQLSDKRWKNLKSHHIPFFIYTVDSPERVKKLIKMGVKGIFTNHPDVLRDIISDAGQAKSTG